MDMSTGSPHKDLYLIKSTQTTYDSRLRVASLSADEVY